MVLTKSQLLQRSVSQSVLYLDRLVCVFLPESVQGRDMGREKDGRTIDNHRLSGLTCGRNPPNKHSKIPAERDAAAAYLLSERTVPQL